MESSMAVQTGPGERAELSVQGMNCSGCVRHVTEALQAVEGVASVVVALEAGRATVRWQPGARPDAAALALASRQAGYPAQPISGAADQPDGPAGRAGRWQAGVVLGVVPTALLMAGEWLLNVEATAWYPW